MDELLQQLAAQITKTANLLTVTLIMGRTMPMVFTAPFMGGALAPNTVKMAIGVLFTILLYPMARESTGQIPLNPLVFFVLFLKEIFIGFSMGFIASELWACASMSGRIVDTARGSSMAEVQDPATKTQATPIGEMYSQFLLVLFFAMGGHRVFILAFVHSYELIPLNAVPDFGVGMWPFIDLVMHWSSDILTIAAILAAPMMIATFMTDLSFGILNRVAPQLNAYFMAMPIKAMAGLALILVSWNLLAFRLHHYIALMLQHVQDVVYYLASTAM